MDDGVMFIIDEISEYLIGYIGKWLDENPNFQQSTAEAVVDEIRHRVKAYLNCKIK